MTAAVNPPLPLGYSPVPPGCVVNAVTCLEMLERPSALAGSPFVPPYRLEPTDRADLAAYRTLFRRVGEPWLWSSRLAMPDERLSALLSHPDIDVYTLSNGSEGVGILELDFRESSVCELSFFGLAPGATGQGLGRQLMDAAIARAWARPITRFWVHTCTFDHPRALGFYQHAGFRAYEFQVEVMPDPRLTGILPRTAAPHIPLVDRN